MKLFRKDSSYAVRTLVYIARQSLKEPLSSTRVSEALGIPKNFLRRIFSQLIRAGILKGTEGARGGVTLARLPAQINVFDVISVLQGDIKICHSFHGKEPCPDQDACVMQKRIMEIEKSVMTQFRNITIQSLLDESD